MPYASRDGCDNVKTFLITLSYLNHVNSMEQEVTLQEQRYSNAMASHSGVTKAEKQVQGSIAIWKLFRHADGKDVGMMLGGSLGAMASGASIPVLMIISAQIMQAMKQGPFSSGLLTTIDRFCLYMIYWAVGVCVAAFADGYCWTRTAERQAARMRRQYLKAVLRQEVGFFDTQSSISSEAVLRVTNDALVVQDVLSEKLPNFILNASTFVASVIMSLVLAWRVALVALPLLLLLLVPGSIYARILMTTSKKMAQAYNAASRIAQAAVSSIRTVYSFVAEEKTQAQFENALNNCVKFGLRAGLYKGMAVGSTGATLLIWAFILWYSSRLVMYHGFSAADVLSAGFTIVLGGRGLDNAIPNLQYFSEAVTAGKRVFDMVDRVPPIDSEDYSGKVLDTVSGEVEFRHVEFAYPVRPESKILRDFCLKIPAGKTVALVGSSGSGKSTAIALLERFYDPNSGEIELDGVDIRTLKLSWLRNQMGLVSQEPALFGMSIKDNISLGHHGATFDDVVDSAISANAHDFITKMPNGYDTQVGERGVQISGGQKQRIAIARAIVKNPALLLLDEATSALDAESEKTVQEALDTASLGRTTVIVAHRLATIRNAHLIAVVESGKIVEIGTHHDLILRPDGAYASLVHLQEYAHEKTPDNQSQQTRSKAKGLEGKVALANLAYSGSVKDKSSRSFRSSEHTEIDSDVVKEEKTKIETTAAAPPLFWELLSLSVPEWKEGVTGCVGAALAGVVQPVFSLLLADSGAVLFQTDHAEIRSRILRDATALVCVGVVAFFVHVVQHYYLTAMGEQLAKRVRVRMLEKMMTFEVAWFDRAENSSGAISARLATEANAAKSLVGDRMSLLVQMASAVATSYALTLGMAWRLAVVGIAVQPLVVAAFYARKVMLRVVSRRAVAAQNASSQLAAEAVFNHPTVTALSAQARLLQLFDAAQQGPARANQREAWVAGLVLGMAQLIDICNVALLFWYGGHLLYRGHVTLKTFLVVFLVLRITGRVIAEAGSMTADIAKGEQALKAVFLILRRASLIPPDDPTARKANNIRGEIQFRNVEFAYPLRPEVAVLNGLNLRIRAGSSVALVGQSGSGKSTVVSLVQRFYDPTEGAVLIDGVDVRHYNLRWLRGRMAMVAQEPVLFSGSIRDNIAYGNASATEAEIVEAAKAANAHGFVMQLENGYATECGDKGAQLSGGQKQRIAIARAIVRNPRIVLLDEATSALDSVSEKVVQEALNTVMHGRTSVVVAHRLSTVQTADSIIFMSEGRAVEEGNHEQLIAKGPGHPYYSLYTTSSSDEVEQ